MKNLYYIFLVMFIVIGGCKKSNPTSNSNNSNHLIKITNWTPSTNIEVARDEILFDAGGNLTGFKVYSSGSLYYNYTVIEKNSANQVTKIAGTDPKGAPIIHQFVYDSHGNIIQYNVTYLTDADLISYTYDGNSRVTAISHTTGTNPSGLTTYTYVSSATSPATEKIDPQDPSSPFGISNYSLQFDDKKNPATGVPQAIALILGADQFFYKNNITNRTTGPLSSNFTYEYNANGFATSQRNSTSDAGYKFYYAQ